MFHIRQVIDVGRENSPLYYGQPLYSGDAGAHKWIVLLRDGMQMVDLEGASAICYFTRPTNADEKREAPEVQSVTLILNAVIADGAALVTWTADCYAGVGPFTAIMVIARGEEIAGVAIVTGMIRSRSSSAIKDPSTLIPSIDVLLAQIGAMRTATADAKSAAQEARDTMSGTQEALEEAQEALETAQEAAKAAQGWGDATASAETLDAGAGATVEVSTGASGAKVLAFGIPRGESGVYIGTEEPTDPTVQVWIDPDGEADELPSGVTPEEIQAAVENYLTEHPVTSGATEEQAAQIQENKEDIDDLNVMIGDISTALDALNGEVI